MSRYNIPKIKNKTASKLLDPRELLTNKKVRTLVDPANLNIGGSTDAMFGKANKTNKAAEEAAQAQAMADRKAATDEFTAAGPAKYEAGTPLAFENMSPAEKLQWQQLSPAERQARSGMSDITTDPKYKEHELAALRELEDQAQNGFTARDRADMQRTENQVNRANKGRIASIMQNQQARGMGGGGMDLMAQLQSSQNSNEIAAMRALEQEGMMQDRKSAATMNLGNMSSQLQNRDFGQEAAKAQAQDAINRFNTANSNDNARFNNQGINQTAQNNWQQTNADNRYNNSGRNEVAQNNWNRNNSTADRNSSAQYDFNRDRMGAKTGQSAVDYNRGVEGENRKMLEDQQAEAAQSDAFRNTVNTAGGVWGAWKGGGGKLKDNTPRANTKNTYAEAYGQDPNRTRYAKHGGWVENNNYFASDPEVDDSMQGGSMQAGSPFDVPNKPEGYESDSQPYMLTPGELVVPPEYAKSPEKAADFVRELQDDPSQDSTTERNPIMNQSILARLSKNNPSLIDAYRKKMEKADSNLASAEKYQRYGGVADELGKVLTEYSNGQRRDVILKNRMEDLGRAPTVSKANQDEWHSIMPGFDKKVAQAQADKKSYRDQMYKEMELEGKDEDRQMRREDRNDSKALALAGVLGKNVYLDHLLNLKEKGMLSKQDADDLDRALKAEAMGNKSNIDNQRLDLDKNKLKFSEKELEVNKKLKELEIARKTGDLKEEYRLKKELEAMKIAADKDAAKRKEKEDKIKPLSGEALKRFDETELALTGVRNVANAIASKKFTKDQMLKIPGRGDTEYTLARKTYEQGMIRLQSGGAATPTELMDLAELQPELFDTREIMLKKSNQMITILTGIEKRIKNNQQGEEVKTNKELFDQYVIFTPKDGGKPKRIPKEKVTPEILEDAKRRGMKVSR